MVDKAIREARFSCPKCLVSFDVNVESDKPLDVVVKEFPSSMAWMRSLCSGEGSCPVCGCTLDLEDV